MPTVSVVMPAYNAEKYIGQAFESLIAQTYSDWQCVVVNDGSTDGTLEIIERYAARDNRFCFATIKNSGSAKIPRYTAIGMADSDWIISLDADDYLAADALDTLIKRQQQTDADIVCLQLALFDNQTKKPLHTIPAADFDFNQIMSGKDAMMATVGGWMICGNGLFKRDFWNNRITVVGAELCHMNADEYDTREMFSNAKIVAFADTSYHYRIDSGSITRNISPKLFETIMTDRMVAELVERVFGSDSPEHRKARAIAMSSLLGKYFMWARYAKKFSAEQRYQVYQLIRTERARYSRAEIWDSELSVVKKLLLIAPRWMVMIPIRIFVAIKYRS